MESLPAWLNPALVWFIIGTVLLLAEFMIPGLIIFFFGVAAWIVAFVCLAWGIPLNAQLALFLVSSVLLIFSLRRWLKTVFRGYVTAYEDEGQMDGFVGEYAEVTEAIQPPNRGRVEFRGTNWNAEADVEVATGASVRIIAKDNLTLKVKPL